MYLGSGEIRRRIDEDALLENIDLDGLQGSGVDLRIDRLFSLTSEASIGKTGRNLPEMEEIEGEFFTLMPRGYYLCVTAEKVNMPIDLVAFILPRSTLFRCGVSLRSAVVDPGYKGVLTIGLRNESDYDFRVEKGARIAQIVFSNVSGDAMSYQGKYQGGKVR